MPTHDIQGGYALLEAGVELASAQPGLRQLLASNESISKFTSLLKKWGVAQALEQSGKSVTIFAPQNDWFSGTPFDADTTGNASFMANLESEKKMVEFLNSHVVLSKAIIVGREKSHTGGGMSSLWQTGAESHLVLTERDDGVFANATAVVKANLLFRNGAAPGVLHILSGALPMGR